ncbi:type II secretion system protein [Anaerobacillus alkaliphilus]|uniref:type II secretion system protein n=1 Tax=Anaerobacillus alkaliphilus TaxID=1548597 RepID=UPI001375A25E|nr:type II secretion system protein [Anaerobacillus alkaliphilus]
MNNSKGFSLIEVMTSLMILSLTSMAILPALNQVYEERMAILQEKQGINILEKMLTEWTYDGDFLYEEEINDLETMYRVSYTFADSGPDLKVCVTWQGRNQRLYERCASAKK